MSAGVTPTNVLANFRAETRQSTSGPCLEPWNIVLVMAAGNVKACCGTTESFGNVTETPLLEIYN
jgi:hypothetical protein